MKTVNDPMRLHGHTYWSGKKQFQLDSDTYEEWVMFVVESGTFQFRIAQFEGLAASGDVVLCPPYTAFERKVISPLSFHFIRMKGETKLNIPGGLMHLKQRSRVLENARQLRRYALDASEWGWQVRDHMAQDLWLQILLEHETKQEQNRMHTNPETEQMFKVKAYISEHAFTSMKLKHIASHFHLTPVQLTRQFKETFGQKPIDYLTELRIGKATHLLCSTDWTLDGIAEACGYENGFYLSRVFTRHMKMRPSEFRKQNQV